MAEYLPTVNIAGAKAGVKVTRDPADPRTDKLVQAGVLVPLDPTLHPKPEAAPAKAPKRSGVVTTSRRKGKVKEAAPVEEVEEVPDVFGDRDGGNAEADANPEAEVEVEPEAEVEAAPEADGPADPES